LPCSLSGATFDLRLVFHELDCANDVFTVDLEIRSAVPADSFEMASGNLRMSFNRAALQNPRVDAIFGFSGFVSFAPLIVYAPSNLNGSLDTIISYNILFQTGFSQMGQVVPDTWTPIGRLAFDVVDYDQCADIYWHSATVFPRTVVLEYSDTDGTLDGNGSLGLVAEGTYEDLFVCFGDLLPNVNATITDSDCSSPTGGASLSVTGGTAPYTYSWETSDTTASISNVDRGSYTVLVTDSVGCMKEDSVLIGPFGPELSLLSTVGGCPSDTTIDVAARVCNTGTSDLPVGTPIAFYHGDPRTISSSLAEVQFTTAAIAVDSCQDLVFTLPHSNSATIYPVVNDDGTGSLPYDLTVDFPITSQSECDYLDNLDSITCACCVLDPNLEEEEPIEPALEEEKFDFALMPNPVHDQLHIRVREELMISNGQVSIHDMSGKVWARHTIPSDQSEHTFMLTDLPEGLYVVKLLVGLEYFSHTFVKME